MAVPKKRRTNRILLNRGVFYKKRYLTIFTTGLAYLTLQLMQRRFNEARPTLQTSIRRFAHLISMKKKPNPARLLGLGSALQQAALKRQRWSPRINVIKCRLQGLALLSASAPVSKWAIDAALRPLFPITYLSPFYLKQLGLANKAPHFWGPQKHVLTRGLSLYPRYTTLINPWEREALLNTHVLGLVYPLWAKNLHRPKGPTLKALWTYAKTNPNEGYWIYCMWLNVRKRWLRWLTFSCRYLWTRNILHRSMFSILMLFNFNIHRYQYFSIKFTNLFLKLKLWEPLHKTVPSQTFLTRVAHWLVTHSFLKKK